MNALGCEQCRLQPQGFPVHERPVAAGSVLVWVLNYAIKDTGFPLSGLPCVECRLFVLKLMVKITARAPGILSIIFFFVVVLFGC